MAQERKESESASSDDGGPSAPHVNVPENEDNRNPVYALPTVAQMCAFTHNDRMIEFVRSAADHKMTVMTACKAMVVAFALLGEVAGIDHTTDALDNLTTSIDQAAIDAAEYKTHAAERIARNARTLAPTIPPTAVPGKAPAALGMPLAPPEQHVFQLSTYGTANAWFEAKARVVRRCQEQVSTLHREAEARRSACIQLVATIVQWAVCLHCPRPDPILAPPQSPRFPPICPRLPILAPA